jgi:hypothetical protein
MLSQRKNEVNEYAICEQFLMNFSHKGGQNWAFPSRGLSCYAAKENIVMTMLLHKYSTKLQLLEMKSAIPL